MPSIHRLVDPERAHRWAVKLAKYSLVPRIADRNDAFLQTSVLGLKFDNPIGLAAGFDKDGEGVQGLSKMGFGFIEVGSVTPLPQEGNVRPRVFRLFEEKGIINRYGFNSVGHEGVRENLRKAFDGRGSPSFLSATASETNGSNFRYRPVIGLNLGKNKSSPESSVEDFSQGLKFFSSDSSLPIDYFVINVSSPNTPGLRSLQTSSNLIPLLDSIAHLKLTGVIRKPILLKISPDLSLEERKEMSRILLSRHDVIDGIIVSNTTISRPSTSSTVLQETGGLSGSPLRPLSTEAIRDFYRFTQGKIPIIGVGGVFTGEDALEKIKAGASLIQIYTSLTYDGPPVVSSIKRDLVTLLKEQGFSSISQAVGVDHQK